MSYLKKSALAFCIVTSIFSSTVEATVVPYVPPVAQETIKGCLVDVSIPYWLYVVGFAAYYHITKK